VVVLLGQNPSEREEKIFGLEEEEEEEEKETFSGNFIVNIVPS